MVAVAAAGAPHLDTATALSFRDRAGARVPAGRGVAFVIVQHLLDPTHKGITPELLQRATGMKVIQVKDRTRARPDCVYGIPPNKDGHAFPARI